LRHFVVLPGMHGTTELMDDFQRAAPGDAHVELVALPAQLSGYSELASALGSTIRLTPDSILIAESFSGPLAILLAERVDVAALILCNTFAKAPYFGAFALLPLSLLVRMPPPSFLIRYVVIGTGAPGSMVSQVKKVLEHVPAEVLAERTRSVLHVDVTHQLSRVTSPILCLHGTRDHLVRRWSLNAIVRAATVPVAIAEIDAPHLLLKTSPREAWIAIETFLDARLAGDPQRG
jgi:pimeloyl-[acyl-carrier protein] methyl ester esterase